MEEQTNRYPGIIPRDLHRPDPVGRVVFALLREHAPDAFVRGNTLLVGQQLHEIRALLQWLAVAFREDRTALNDTYEAGAAVLVSRLDRLVEQRRVPVHDLGHEGDIGHSQGDGERVERWQGRPFWVGVGRGLRRRRGRCLLLGQPVDAVVKDQDHHIHVVAHGMEPVAGADGEAVAIPGSYPHVQVRAAGLDAVGQRQRPTVQAVEAVGADIVGQAAGAADAGDGNGLFRRHLGIAQDAMHGIEYREIAATRAPARLASRIIAQCEITVEDLYRPVSFQSKHWVFS